MKVIAFVDGSDYAASVCDYTAWAARQMSADIEIFHMLGRRSPGKAPSDLSGSLNLGARTALLEELAKADEEWARLAHVRGRAILEGAVARVEEENPGLNVQSRLRNDDLVETLCLFEDEANLIVLGKRGEASGFAREHLGSNLERTLRSVGKPVLVANHDFRPVRRCLVAFDGGASINKAVRLIAEGRLLKNVACDLLSVSKRTPETIAPLEGAAALLQNAGLKVTFDVREGDPDTVIPEVAGEKDSDMLIMGAYGHSRMRNLIIGSTTTSIVRSCKLPVLMFR